MEPALFNVPADCEIVSTRMVNASRESVFRAWTDPVILQKWWGPAGFTNTFNEFYLRPGGKWSFVMHGPDKGSYKNECVFLEIKKPELIAWDRLSEPIFRMVVSFEAITAARTKIIFRMQFETKESCDKIRGFAPGKNEENFDRLEAELSALQAAR